MPGKIRTENGTQDREVHGDPITQRELTTEKMQSPPKNS